MVQGSRFNPCSELLGQKRLGLRDCSSGSNKGEWWSPLFNIFFNNWEVEDVERLLAQLGKVTLVDEVEDATRWTVINGGVFSVKSMYRSSKPQLN